MKKILFVADIHIKLGQKNVPREWAINRYNILWSEIVLFATETKGVDYLIIGGDTFDKAPSMEELGVFFDMLLKLDCSYIKEILIYSGNHEALKKNTTFLSYLRKYLLRHQNVRIIDDVTTYHGMDFLPYNALSRLKEIVPNSKVLFTHVRGAIPPHVQPEVDLSLFDRWEIVFAGDLHSRENSQRNIVYPGSPVTTSFHRNKVDTGMEFITIDESNIEHRWIKLTVPQLLRKTVSNTQDMVKTTYDHTIYELEGSVEELFKLTKGNKIDSSLLDKKLVSKVSQPSLDLSQATTIQDELAIYLKSILKMDDVKVKRLVNKLNDSIG